MTSYGNSFPKRKGNYPRKSERELESFLPDNMKTPHWFSGHSTQAQDRKKQFAFPSAPDDAESKYSYSDSAKKFISRQNKENKRNGYSNQDAHISRKEWDQTDNGNSYGREISSASPKPVFMKPKKIMKPFAKISSETFETAAIDKMPAMPPQIRSSKPAPITVLSRNVKKVEEKKEPVKRIQILKPTSNVSSTGGVPRIPSVYPPTPGMSIWKPSIPTSERGFKILAPASKMRSTGRSYISGQTYVATHLNPLDMSRSDPKVAPAKQMRQPFRVIDADFTLCEGYTAFNAFLVEQPSFVVVGVVGRQGVGKSTVASLLAQSTLNGSITERGFRASGRSELQKGSHCTGGIDAYISAQRVIVLDFPAILAPGVLDATVNSDLGRRALELQVHTRSLELLALALRVCHFIVAVQDSREQGTQLLKCLQAAAVVNQRDIALSTPVVRESDDTTTPVHPLTEAPPITPTVMLVCNKVPANTASSRQALRAIEVHARRQLRPGLLNVSCGVGVAPARTVNLFTLPLVPGCAKDRSKLSSSALQLRAAIMGLERRTFPGYDAPPTERDWFEYVIREWEKILKSSLYLDYSRLFP